MSWLQKLSETYDRCAGKQPDGVEPMMPVSHTTQQAHIEIVLDAAGGFKRASVLDKSASTTMIPCTEESGGRAGSKPVNHPLCDKLQYIAGDYADFGGEVTSGFASNPDEPHKKYLESLRAWANSQFPHPKLNAIQRYVQSGHVVADLVASKVLQTDRAGKLLKEWVGSKDQAPPIFKAIPATQTQEDSFVRWRVEETGNPVSSTWQDPALIAAWVAYYQSTQGKHGYCMVNGKEAILAVQHPAKLRHGGDKAKLISSNDTSGYTFRGRFLEADEAASVGFLVTQKAHNALRWLIARQGSRNGDQVVVTWSVVGKAVPDPFLNTLELFGLAGTDDAQLVSSDAGQSFAMRLNKAIAGYRAKLDPADDIVVMGIDSATPGRMAITFYREIRGSDFLNNVEAWHALCSWPQNFGKDAKFIGAPAPRDIAEAAFGRRLDDKLRKATVERLLPCIIDRQSIPRDLVESCSRRANNRVGLEPWEWEKCVGIACALFKGYHTNESYSMSLETTRTTRDYLFGRLLAVAEHIEGRALYVAGEKRDTTAARLMQRFSDRPYSTWKTIELSLVPYKTRLRAQRAGFLYEMEKLLDDVVASFTGDTFTKDTQLTGEFLLGYHCQRQALRPVATAATEDDSTNTND
jgi:CRISPR-associated protein Csd1